MLTLIALVNIITTAYCFPKLGVLQKIRQQQNLTTFSKLLELTALSKNSLYYSEVTVFAPTNEAFNKFDKINSDITNYHMVYSVYKLNELTDGNLESINSDNPPLWVKRNGDNEIFINNAMILMEKSDYFARNMPSRYGKAQILHVIDEVLDVSFKNEIKNPTAFDFLNQTNLWGNYEIFKFLNKIILHHCENYFKKDGGFTFFIPVDHGINEQRFNLIDSYIIKGHIIKNKVLFTRPSLKDYFYETLTNDGDYIQIKLAFNRFYDSFQVKSNTLVGDTNHLTGEIKADILVANIPVKNGVIHLISKPLAVFDEKLTKFPYLDVFDKFSMDPYLNVSYYLGSRSGFNKILKENLTKKKFTFFIPRDFAWKLIETNNLMDPSRLDLVKTILSRHLIVSDVPYFMDSLVDGSKDGCMHLNTPNGKVCFGAAKDHKKNSNKYYVIWNGIYVEVYRADYECKNGIVHVVDRPFVTGDEIEGVLKEKNEGVGVFRLWGAVISLIFSKKN